MVFFKGDGNKCGEMVEENRANSFHSLSIMTREEALSLARKYKKLLQDAHIPMSAFIVFGSVARNEMHEQSDVDIAVVGTSFKGDRFEEMHDIRKLRYPISYKLQPIWFYPEHLEDKYSTLAQEIARDGIEV